MLLMCLVALARDQKTCLALDTSPWWTNFSALSSSADQIFLFSQLCKLLSKPCGIAFCLQQWPIFLLKSSIRRSNSALLGPRCWWGLNNMRDVRRKNLPTAALQHMVARLVRRLQGLQTGDQSGPELAPQKTGDNLANTIPCNKIRPANGHHPLPPKLFECTLALWFFCPQIQLADVPLHGLPHAGEPSLVVVGHVRINGDGIWPPNETQSLPTFNVRETLA